MSEHLYLHTQLGDVMGEGVFGPVIMGVARNIIHEETQTLVVVKALLYNDDRVIEGEEDITPETALADFADQMKLKFTNIAAILGMCTDAKPYYIIYEYLDEVAMLSDVTVVYVIDN